MKRALLLLLLALWGVGARGAEPFLREGDVISFIGGQEMVEAAENGDFELALTALAPELHLRFRSLAREGDTVFEQHRDLNYPPLTEQVATTKSTVLIAGFGAMESLAGAGPENFSKAYEELLERLTDHAARRVVLVAMDFSKETRQLAERHGWAVFAPNRPASATRDSAADQAALARWAVQLEGPADQDAIPADDGKGGKLRSLITAKNQLWYHYYRPQNWAFLAGDRTNQPSSRDHLDPAKRWFPEEMQKFLPLIEAKEKEIDALANAH